MEGKEGEMTDLQLSLSDELRKQCLIRIVEPDHAGIWGRGSG